MDRMYTKKIFTQVHSDAEKQPLIPQEYLDFVNDNISGGVIIVFADADYSTYFINDTMLEMLGYTRNEYFTITKGKYVKCIHPDDLDEVIIVTDKVLSDKDMYSVYYRLLTKSGDLIWVKDIAKKIVFADGQKLLICLCIDITKTIELQEALKILNDSYEYITSSLPCGICKTLADKDMTILYANEAYYDIFGYTPLEAYAAGFTTRDFVICEEDKQKAQQAMDEALNQGKHVWEVELHERHKSGRILNIWSKCNYIPEINQIISVTLDVSERKYMEEQIRIREEEYRIVIIHCDKLILRYDAQKRSLILPQESMDLLGLPAVVENVPYSLIKADLVAASSQEEYIRFYESMIAGQPKGYCVVCLKNATGNFAWYRLDYTMIYDEKKSPYRAIISYEDITEQREKEMAYDKWQQSFSMLSEEKIIYYEFNLTQEVCELEKGALVYHVLDKVVNTPTAIFAYVAEHFVYQPDRRKFLDFTNRDRLLAYYYSGITEDSLEFCIQNDDDPPRWLCANIQMVQYPYSQDIKAYVLFEDIDKHKQQELAMQARLSEDSLTGAMNRTAFIERVKEILQQDGDGQYAFVMLDIDYFKSINDNFGHVFGDEILVNVVNDLRKALRADDLIGRLGGDEFMICMCNIPFYAVEKRAQFLIHMIERKLSDYISVSASIGIALYPCDGNTFEELYLHADVALYNAKQKGRNCYVVYQPYMSKETWIPNNTPIIYNNQDDLINSSLAEDIADQKCKILEKLKEDERYRIIMEFSDAVIIDQDLRTGAFFAGHNFAEYLLTEDDISEIIEGSYNGDAIYIDDRKCFTEALLNPIIAGERKADIVVRLQKTDGHYQWNRVLVVCMHDRADRLERVIFMISPVDNIREQVFSNQ